MTELPAPGPNPRDIPTCPHCGHNRSSRGIPFDSTTLDLHVQKCRANPGTRSGGSVGGGSSPMPESGLFCHVCGATGGRRGGFFRDIGDLRKHMTQCQRKSGGKGKEPPAAATPVPSTMNAPSPPRVAAPARRVPTAEVKFCPQCGCNLEVISAALSFVR